MLIRHADACFWLGRYAERVEATARAIDTVYHVRLERPFADDVLGWDSILAIYGHEAHGPADERAVLHRLVFDEENPGSIRSGMRAARENARGVRDLISSEMWEALNEAYLDIEAWDVDRVLRRSPHAFFRRVRNELRLFDGITGRTMVRDEGREFLAAGRHLERAAQTARILDIKYHHLLPATALSVADDARGIGGEVDLQGWAAVLRSVGAYEAYVSRHGSEISTSLVAGFLVLDAGFPASVVHSVRRIDVALRRISRNWDPRPASEAERLTGRLLGDLVFTDGRELVDAGLHEFLIDVIARCDAVGQAIADEFLPA